MFCAACGHSGSHAYIVPRDAKITRCPDCPQCRSEAKNHGVSTNWSARAGATNKHSS